jgi:hypothetical protein
MPILPGIHIAIALARVTTYANRVMLQIVASFTDNSKEIIYNCNTFIELGIGDKIFITMLELC